MGHVQRSVVDLHVVAASAPVQMQVDADELFVLFASFLEEVVSAVDLEEHLSQLLGRHLICIVLSI